MSVPEAVESHRVAAQGPSTTVTATTARTKRRTTDGSILMGRRPLSTERLAKSCRYAGRLRLGACTDNNRWVQAGAGAHVPCQNSVRTPYDDPLEGCAGRGRSPPCAGGLGRPGRGRLHGTFGRLRRPRPAARPAVESRCRPPRPDASRQRWTRALPAVSG